MVYFPPCKINIGLRILRKRSDGYHDIETGFYPIPFTDILELIRAEDTTFSSSGIPIPGNAADNLCLKAYHLLRQDYNLEPVRIHLHKLIPTGAGLGGGSSDAAYTLRALNEIFQLGLSATQLTSYASQLGSDCSYFIHNEPMLGTGRGEILEPVEVDLKGKFLILVNPRIHISTAAAYAGVRIKSFSDSLRDRLLKPMHQWRDEVGNDFERSVFEQFPLIAQLKQTMYDRGALYASMSGSGSSVYGIFEADVAIAENDPMAAMLIWKGFL